MKLLALIVSICLLQISDILKENQGAQTFTYLQCEYADRILDFPIEIFISGNHITGIQKKNYVTGGDTIINSFIFIHQSGKYIISDSVEDKNSDEVGCCTGILVIDFKKKTIEAC